MGYTWTSLVGRQLSWTLPEGGVVVENIMRSGTSLVTERGRRKGSEKGLMSERTFPCPGTTNMKGEDSGLSV